MCSRNLVWKLLKPQPLLRLTSLPTPVISSLSPVSCFSGNHCICFMSFPQKSIEALLAIACATERASPPPQCNTVNRPTLFLPLCSAASHTGSLGECPPGASAQCSCPVLTVYSLSAQREGFALLWRTSALLFPFPPGYHRVTTWDMVWKSPGKHKLYCRVCVMPSWLSLYLW